MSITQAKGLLQSLRWHHLGFCFFWAVTFVALVEPEEAYGEAASLYSVVQQLVTLVAVVVIAAVSVKSRAPYNPQLASLAAAGLSAGSLLYYLVFFFGEFSFASAMISAVLVGVSQGGFFVMWQSFFASEGTSRTTIYIPLSALCSVALCIVVTALPFEWLVVCAVVVLPSLAGLTLQKSLSEIVPYELEPMNARRVGGLVRSMAPPVFCVCAIGFVWRVVNRLSGEMGIDTFMAVMLGMSCATLLVTLVELFSERGFDALHVYPVMFPVVAAVFLLPTALDLFDIGVLAVLSMFGFEVLNLLLLSLCAAYASQNAMNSTLVYATCVGPALLALLLGEVVGEAASESGISSFAASAGLTSAVFYLVVFILLLVSLALGLANAAKKVGEASGGSSLAEIGREGEAEREIGSGESYKMAHVDISVVLAEEDAPNCALRDDKGKSVESLADGDFDQEEGLDWTAGASDENSILNLGSTGQTVPDVLAEASGTLLMPSQQDANLLSASLSSETVGPTKPVWEARLDALDLADPLSAREREVTDLLLRGNTVAAIARKLFISENTVRSHAKNIYRKLGVHSRQELVDLLG